MRLSSSFCGIGLFDWSTRTGYQLKSKLRHTGEGRCPSRKWVPAFPTEQVRGLKAHGKEEEDAALNHLNASEY